MPFDDILFLVEFFVMWPLEKEKYESMDYFKILVSLLYSLFFTFPVDFVLKDPREKDEDKSDQQPAHREELAVVPKPWHKSYVASLETAKDHLHVTNPCMLQVLQLWHTSFR